MRRPWHALSLTGLILGLGIGALAIPGAQSQDSGAADDRSPASSGGDIDATSDSRRPAATPDADATSPNSVPIGSKLAHLFDVVLPDSDGVPTQLASRRGTKATVLLFVSTECPISNGYLPTVARLSEAFARDGVEFWLINPNDGQTLKTIALHRKEYQVREPVLKDAGAALARRTGVSRCPEAAILDADGVLRYRGRIDDRYQRRGGAATRISRHDLENALAAVVAGKSAPHQETEAVGCPIVAKERHRLASEPNESAEVTWTSHIASLMQEHCLACHRPGGAGPFSLQTFEQAVSWADDIRTFTADRTMPPWLPADGFGRFHNRRALTDEQIALIAGWVDAGCPQGDPADEPKAAVVPTNWTMGPPDLVLKPEGEYRLSAEGDDVYRCFVLPTGLTEDRFVKAIEVLPGNARIVHHVIAFLDMSGQSATLDARDPEVGYSTSAGFPGFVPSGGLGGWAPGNQPRRLPDGMGKPLPAGSTVVMQVHYHRSGKHEVDQTKLGVHFAKEKITRAVQTLPVMPFGGPLSGMKIPAGEANHEVRASVTLPRDLQVVTVTPHMHLIGKSMKLTAMTPAGDEEKLLWVKRWDFHWQESYQYETPVPLPAGTRIDLVAHFDNSTENPNNPSTPPRLVRWGEQTTDEMCIAFLEVVPREEARSASDLKPQKPGEFLREAIRQKLRDALRSRLGR